MPSAAIERLTSSVANGNTDNATPPTQPQRPSLPPMRQAPMRPPPPVTRPRPRATPTITSTDSVANNGDAIQFRPNPIPLPRKVGDFGSTIGL